MKSALAASSEKQGMDNSYSLSMFCDRIHLYFSHHKPSVSVLKCEYMETS